MNKERIFKEYSEYLTTDTKEAEYLKQNGIRYDFIKTVDGATVYKYKKTRLLFETLSCFRKFQ